MYRLITENINDLIVIINRNFEFEFINEPVHLRLRGVSNRDRIGKSVFSIIHPEDQKVVMETGDYLTLRSNTAGSADIIVSALEIS